MVWKLDRVVEVDFKTTQDEKLEFRLELFSTTDIESRNRFKARVFRYEAFNCEPAFEVDPEFQKAVHFWAILEPREEIAPLDIVDADKAITWYISRLCKALDLAVYVEPNHG